MLCIPRLGIILLVCEVLVFQVIQVVPGAVFALFRLHLPDVEDVWLLDDEAAEVTAPVHLSNARGT